jgi:hypothetical protein
VEKHPTHCVKHKADGMRDVRSRRCAYEGCTTQPCFGFVDKQPTHCVKHKADGMRDVHSDRCTHEGCTTQPCFGFVEKHPTHCAQHKSDDMRDVVHPHCAHMFGDGTICPVYATGNAGFCARHDTTQARRRKSKEMAVVDYLRKDFTKMVHNHIEYVECSSVSLRYYFPDMTWDLGSWIVHLEVDEEQHKSYTCESRRIMELAQARFEVATLLVRYNPDAMHIDGSTWRWQQRDRLYELRRVLDWCMTPEAGARARDYWSTGRVLCVYLFYDDQACRDETGVWPGKVMTLRVSSVNSGTTVYETSEVGLRI